MKFHPMNVLNLVLIAVIAVLVAVAGLVSKSLAQRLAALFEPWEEQLEASVVCYAVVNTKSTTVTNLDAAQVVRAKAHNNGAPLKEWIETISHVSGDSIASTYRYFRVPSWLRVSELIRDHGDIGTTGLADIGLYRTAADGGAVVDADFFGSAVSLSGGAISDGQVAHESGVIAVADYGKRIWEQLGLTADPQIYYDVVMTLTAAHDATGNVTLRLRGTEV